MLVFEVSCRCTVRFHASMLGTTSLSGRVLGCTLPWQGPPAIATDSGQIPKSGRIPLLGIAGKAAEPEMGPQIDVSNGAGRHPGEPAGEPGVPVKLYAGVLLSNVAELSVWWAKTGRFCVTVWPNSDPKTPM